MVSEKPSFLFILYKNYLYRMKNCSHMSAGKISEQGTAEPSQVKFISDFEAVFLQWLQFSTAVLYVTSSPTL